MKCTLDERLSSWSSDEMSYWKCLDRFDAQISRCSLCRGIPSPNPQHKEPQCSSQRSIYKLPCSSNFILTLRINYEIITANHGACGLARSLGSPRRYLHVNSRRVASHTFRSGYCLAHNHAQAVTREVCSRLLRTSTASITCERAWLPGRLGHCQQRFACEHTMNEQWAVKQREHHLPLFSLQL